MGVRSASIGVDAGGQVYADHGALLVARSIAVYEVQNFLDRAFERSVTAGAQDGIHHDWGEGQPLGQARVPRVLDGVDDGNAVTHRVGHLRIVVGAAANDVAARLGAPTAQMPGDHQAVGAVVARPD